MFKKFATLTLLCLALFPSRLDAQVHQAAVGHEPHVWIGGEYSNFKPDYGASRLDGAAVFGSAYVWKRYGVEGEARFLTFNKPLGTTEKNYLGGPFATLYTHDKFSVNLKVLLGAGLITFPDGIGYGSYFAFVPGGEVDYRLSRRWKVRFDYEYEFWPSAPGFAITAPAPSNGLTPNGFNVGVAYHVF